MTSEYLLGRFPFLAGKEGWKAFAEAFDKPKCVECRVAAAKSWTRPPGGGMIVRDMLRPAHEIQCPEVLRGLGVLEIESDPIVSAQKLASMVISLFSNTPEGEKLREAVAAEGKQLDFKPKERNGFDATQCLFYFIERTKKLPTKKELRIECNHWRDIRTFLSGKQMAYGSKIRGDGGQIWRVISCRPDSKLTSNAEIVACFTLTLTGDTTWGIERWTSSEFSDTQRKFGLDGLPERRGRISK